MKKPCFLCYSNSSVKILIGLQAHLNLSIWVCAQWRFKWACIFQKCIPWRCGLYIYIQLFNRRLYFVMQRKCICTFVDAQHAREIIQLEILFFSFPKKKKKKKRSLTFHAYYLLEGQFAWNVKSSFLKIRYEKYYLLSSVCCIRPDSVNSRVKMLDRASRTFGDLCILTYRCYYNK